jgi:sensor histidine kinase YesM
MKTRGIIEPFKSWWSYLISILIISSLFAMLMFNQFFDSWSGALIAIGWTSAHFLSQWTGHAFIQGKIAQKYEWIDHPWPRLIWTVITVVGYTIFAYIAIQALMNWLVFGKVPAYVYQPGTGQLLYPILISFLVSIITAAIGFFKNLKESIQAQEALKREMLNYKLDALRNQINPHFMFNSLNVLSDLVYEDQKMAVQFIHRFSDIYRYVLDSRAEELVELDKEVEFIKKYIFLLETRFEHKFSVNIEISDSQSYYIVPLSLQLLIENVVKHNEISSAKPLTINICKSGDAILVSNPVQLKKTGVESKKIGLKNLEQQYAHFTKRPVEVKEQNNIFSVCIPLIKADHGHSNH